MEEFDFEKAFREADQKKYLPFAEGLAAYRDALLEKGFFRKEAMRLVEIHAKFIYEMAIEDHLTDEDDLPAVVDDEEDTETP